MSKPTSPTPARRDAAKAYYERRRREGWSLISFWASPAIRAILDAFAAKLGVPRQKAFEEAVKRLEDPPESDPPDYA